MTQTKTTAACMAAPRKTPTAWAIAVAATVLSPATTAAPGGPPNEFDCLIEPAQVVDIRSPVVGLLQRVHAKRGESIHRGQTLVTIESSVERSAADTSRARAAAEGALQVARHKVAATREKARRMDELSQEEFVSAQARDDAAAEARQAEAELKGATENAGIARLEHRQSVDLLNRRVLKAPFDGVVVDQYLYPGALVDGGEGKKPILKIAETRPLAVQAILPFRYFPQVAPGTAVVVIPEKPFTRDIPARISTVDRVIDSAAGTFGVMLKLPNDRQELPGGIRCRLRILELKP